MPDLHFSHPNAEVGELTLVDGATEITWSYNMNVQVFPTYGGEVVQILSVNIGDLMMAGQFRTYAQMERFYRYFFKYMQVASQGKNEASVAGATSYNQKPIRFVYGTRGWDFEIMPTSAPACRWATEVVAPVWQLTAFVVDDYGDAQRLSELIKDNIDLDGLESTEGEFTITGEIGFVADNPWSEPWPQDKTFNPDRVRDAWDEAGDYYNKLIPSYLEGDFDSLTAGIGSSPAFLKWGKAQTTDKSTDQQKRATQRD